MENRKETLSGMKLCRFCLTQSDPMSSLYDGIKAPKDPVPLSLKILSGVGIEVFPSSRMPQYICNQCRFFMDLSYGFKQVCRQADESILQFIQHGKAIGPISWPSALRKVFRAANKGVIAASDMGLIETVTTQSGETVQVMAEEISEDEEEGDDDNVYNVKVGDGPEEGKRIKIVTTDKAPVKKRTRKDSEEESLDRGIKSEGGVSSGCWACDECDCTFPLEQLLALHKAQKHRERLANCEECDAKFFSKYDLASHQLIHSADPPYECASCGTKFKRLQLLKRHEKLVHADVPQKECNRCPAKFLTAEELEAHHQRHTINLEQPYWCKICDKRFHEKETLIKHQDFVHKKKPSFSCQYCPEQFNTVSKLTRHLKGHAGERPYPCKHCNKSFIKSHHYTRHLRMKHGDIRNQGAGAEDAFRCEECEETFSTQDELMYHSALHATRNLVCPLCQEKFDDVDTVTAHIKSHVNGNEFMCDFCELIFTSKEKLDNHVASAHDDELLANDQEMEQDESSMEMDAEEDDDDNSINIKEEDGHMVLEINKAEQFMLPSQDDEEKNDNTQSEDSELEAPYEPPPPKTTNEKPPNKIAPPEGKTEPQVLIQKLPISTPVAKPADSSEKSAPSIIKKAEEIKRQVKEQQTPAVLERSKEKKSTTTNNNKVESSSMTSGASEKSLRLLEKELQDLKRTNTRNEATKTPAKPLENLRKRPVIHTSTPKTRTAEKREVQQTKPVEKPVVPEKKSERRSVNKDIKDSASKETRDSKDSKETRDSKDSKETKEAKGNSVREEKSDKENTKEEVTKVDKREVKEKEKEKAVVKNGVSEKPQEEGVRRSTRPSKVKDYAKMIRDKSTSDEDSEEESYEDDSKETDKSPETPQPRGRGRKSISKTTTPAPAPAKSTAATPASAPKKRGRPRKIQNQEPTPAKIRKEESPVEPKNDKSETAEVEKSKPEVEIKQEPVADEKVEGTESPKPSENSNVMVSPSGQTLKKVPIKALPPGVKPLPLPRSMGAGEVCEMQIGKKVVKVQKIVMTKAEVEEMAKKGLVEMKDGTMVLKQGIKLPGTDPTNIKSSIMGDGDKKQESPKKE